MEVRELHDWDFEYERARRLQERLADQIVLRPLPAEVETVAGADVSFSRKHSRFFAAVVVMTFPGMERVELATADTPPAAPYVPGMLTFREGPTLVEAFRRLRAEPDVFIFDGHGYAHPRRFGLACHMGLWLERPTVGCAKSRLVGTHEEPGTQKGQHTPLWWEEGEEKLGCVLRTRTEVKPVFVSPGHLSDFESSRELVLRCAVKYRLPEPTRQAHLAVGRAKERYVEGRDG